MKITKVCCQGCGADLDIGEGLRFVTCNHCGSKLEVVHDATVTHTRHLERIERTTQAMAGNLKVIELQNDLERLDREWDAERESLMIRNKDGGTSEPSAAASAFGGMILIVGGIVWMVFTASNGAPGIFPLFGLVIIGFGIYSIANGASKAETFNSAQSIYQQRRSRMIRDIELERNRR